MSARDDVSEIFDSAAWQPVEGFDLADITYHRAVDAGVVRIAFDRPEVRNAFRPQTVDELIAALEHARLSPTSAACSSPATGRAPRTAAGRSAPAATSASAVGTATSTTRAARAAGYTCWRRSG